MSVPEPTSTVTSTSSPADSPSEVPPPPSALARYFAAVEASAGLPSVGAEADWLIENLVVSDVMTSTVVSVRDDTPFKQIIEALAGAHVSALPVVDDDGHVLGIVSESDLLAKVAGAGRTAPPASSDSAGASRLHHKADAETAHDLMTSPVVTVRPDAPVAHAARIAAIQHVRRLPVVDAEDELVGIVTRSDLLRVFLRDDEAIRQHVVSLIRRQLFIDTSTIEVSVRDGVVALTGQLASRPMFEPLVDAIRDTTGVVAVHDNITYRLNEAP